MSAATAAAAEVTPARRAAFEVLRRTFEHDAWTDRALRSAAERHGLDGRERALAQPPRLRRGAAARHQRPPRSRARLAAAGKARPAGRWRRSGSGSTSCSSRDAGADHAAVAQAVELAKGGARRTGARARARRGFVNARAAPRRARARGAARGARRRRPRSGRRSRTRARSGSPRLWWQELGADDARSLLAAINEPAETALAGQHPARRPRRGAGAPAAAGFEAPPGSSLLGPPEALVARGPLGPEALGDDRRRRRWCRSRARRRPSSPRSTRSPASGCSTSAPAPASSRPQIAARMGGEGESSRSSSTKGGRRRSPSSASALGAANVDRRGRRRRRGRPRRGLRSRSRGSALHRPRCPRLPPRRALAKAGRPGRAAGRAPAPDPRARARRALRPGGTLVYSTCTISATENEDVVGGRLAERRDATADDLGPPSRRSPRRTTPASCRPAPTATAPTASSSPACARGSLMEAEGRQPRSRARAVPGAASPGCARPSFPGRYRCVFCLRRYELVSAVPELRRAPDDRAHERRRGPPLPALRPLDAEARMNPMRGPARRRAGSRPRSSRPTSRGSARRSPR